LFGGRHAGYSDQGGVSQQLQQLLDQITSQSAGLSQLFSQVTGHSTGSALESIFGQSAGQSVLGGIASAAQGGFSWQSILKDVFPLGGLVSGIAGLFGSKATPAPLQQYDAPPPLNFEAVLGPDGTLSQSSTNQFGFSRSSSPGLDLGDAAGGPYSPYQRGPNGGLIPIAGDPATRYPGVLNLPELSSPYQRGSNGGLIPITGDPTTPYPGVANLPELMQTLVTAPPVSAPGPSAPTLSRSIQPATSSHETDSAPPGSPQAEVPAFDAQWFNDHGNLIASAVRNQLLNFHPIVDAINDL
jgi:hypothetical protein